jgi:hypothetical protein
MAHLRHRTVLVAALAFSALLAFALGIYALFWAVDFVGAPTTQSPLDLFREPGAAASFSGLAEVTVGVLGIAITVVAIIVELAAHRYTPRITYLFVRDPVNILVMSFFVVTALLVLWVEMSLYGQTYPQALVLVATGAMTASLLLLLPYFAYVFDFLDPTRVVDRLQNRAQRALKRAVASDVGEVRSEVIRGIDQLGDIALNSVEKDKAITIEVVNALAALVRDNLDRKGSLPKAWFETAALSEEDPDFVSLHSSVVGALRDRRTWLEMKVLRQFQSLVGTAVNVQRDVSHLVSIRTRQLAAHAARVGDDHALQLLMRFLNTYMRAIINARDVRAAYNLLNEVRTLGEEMLGADREDRVLEIAEYMKFYGQLAFAANLPFLQETAAYDLGALLEIAASRQSGCHDPLLSIFLEIDREPEEGGAQEASLRGVRKAQAKLAAFYLSRGDTEYARRIFDDMRREPDERLRSIYGELSHIQEPEYWEVSDRGINFDWLPEDQRAHLDTFFGWFRKPVA